MNDSLRGKSVAAVVADGFEQSEFEQPYNALMEAGASVDIVSPNENVVKAWHEDNFGQIFKVDVLLSNADASHYDALLLPGGVMSPDKLRMLPQAVAFVRAFFQQGKPIAAICHGPQLLIEADVVRGRILTSYPSLKTDLTNAGAVWINQPVVTDYGLVTSRSPADLPQFIIKMIEEFSEGIHPAQRNAVQVRSLSQRTAEKPL